jgi:hypothetical protein
MRFTIAGRSAVMRLVSTILLTLILACLLLAQAPIGFGPGTLSVGLLDYFDWYAATPSGCTAGSRGMCVGHSPVGDTIYFTGWFADAHLLPVTTGLPVVGTLNDFTSKTCSGNLMVIQLAAFDWAARNAGRIYEVNCMSSYGAVPGASDSPAGWKGHCTSNDLGDQGCSWKSRAPFVRDGMLYLPIERQIPAGTKSIHDATMIVSSDGGATWKNPYTVATAGTASATGDAPLCGAAAQVAGNPCTDASYPGSIMWQSMPLDASHWSPVQYGQDGATPPGGITDGCDPATYVCFISGEQEASIARVLRTNLPHLKSTEWQYYTCPAITDSYRCPGSASGSWTSVFADRTQVAHIVSGGTDNIPMTSFFGVAYIQEFKSYLMAGYQSRPGSAYGTSFAWAPAIQGPWTTAVSSHSVSGSTTSVYPGFISPSLALGYTVVSTNPPHVKLTVVTDDRIHSSQTTPYFSQWDLVLGRTPMLQGGENPRYNNVVEFSTNAGYIFSDSHAPGTIPRKDLAWGFDFYDHGGDPTATGVNGFHEMANGSAFLVACYKPTSMYCDGWHPAYGTTLTTFGAQMAGSGGYSPGMVTMMHETPQTIAIGTAATLNAGLTAQNAPAFLQGNGSYTITGVFRVDSARTAPLWFFGDYSGDNTAVSLGLHGGSNLSLEWGFSGNHWRYYGSFTPTIGNWYFIATTVQANGTTPIAHVWVGVGGALVDEIAGVSRTASGGAPTQTPNVAAAPFRLNADVSTTPASNNASYASLFIHGRALGQAEVRLMYNTVKAKMASRGVTLQ